MPKAIPRAKSRRGPPGDVEKAPQLRGIDRLVQRHQLTIILLLCALAGARVFVFTAAFPPLTNVDEKPHYDLVCKYARGHTPAHLESYGPDSIEVLSKYCTNEYLASEADIEQGFAKSPSDRIAPDQDITVAEYLADIFPQLTNVESTQWPVYYAVAGMWTRLGESCELTGVHLAYWIRFLNVLIYALLVWSAYAFLRRLYPGTPVIHTGVPLLLAFFPQDVFYQISNDVLTPLLFAIAFYFMLRIYFEADASCLHRLVAGLSIAAVLLVKLTNVTILVPLAVVLLMMVRRARASGGLRSELPRAGLVLAVALLPAALWMWRNHLSTGDLTGSMGKAHMLGWSYKPLGAVFDHPVFTPAGACTFIGGLITTFWRGEFIWHRVRIAMPAVDGFYVASTLLFVGSAVAAFLGRRDRRPADERFAGWMGISLLATSVAMLLVLSIIFDFGKCRYPSADYPYLTSGRLMMGALVPFLVLYVTGLDYLMTRARLKVSRFAVLLAIAALVTASEIVLTLPVFASPFNWFHV